MLPNIKLSGMADCSLVEVREIEVIVCELKV